ncbi:zinc finger MYM-type protein 1-like [Setaria italica]|uniref:zinc finger MYM-type protein 1-like n=1 Tax=Setaria italica TaxID=4555 RepID=UPI000BE586A8|nr:zinc finger MYM-type protein 1-like [Setaria italica]
MRSNQPPENGTTEDGESIPVEENDSSDEDKNDYGIEHDPGSRAPISSYDVNDQDLVRRAYIALGPFQPKMKRDAFPQHDCGDNCKFPGGDAFVVEEFRNWNMKKRIHRHVGAIDSAHSEAEEKYRLFTRPKASIRESVASNTAQFKAKYLARLTWSLKCIRFLLRQGLAFRGHDETKDSLNKGNFRELLAWLAGNFEEDNLVVLENAPQNCQMIDHKIQKQLIDACAHETTKFIIDELGDECFAILADESSDAYLLEQLALCLRFVNKKGEPVERFLGLVQVEDTTSLTLKEAIQSLLIKYQLPLSKVRGQGYDGASNMKGHVNGLKKLIMDESPSAYHVHCFAHQLQLTLVAVAKENTDCDWFFGQLAYLLNVLGMSCKKIRMLRIAQVEYMTEALKLGEIETGQGLNQEMGLARPDIATAFDKKTCP